MKENTRCDAKVHAKTSTKKITQLFLIQCQRYSGHLTPIAAPFSTDYIFVSSCCWSSNSWFVSFYRTTVTLLSMNGAILYSCEHNLACDLYALTWMFRIISAHVALLFYILYKNFETALYNDQSLVWTGFSYNKFGWRILRYCITNARKKNSRVVKLCQVVKGLLWRALFRCLIYRFAMIKNDAQAKGHFKNNDIRHFCNLKVSNASVKRRSYGRSIFLGQFWEIQYDVWKTRIRCPV